MADFDDLDVGEQPSEWLGERTQHERDVLQAPDTSMSSMHDAMNTAADDEFHRLHPDAPEKLDAHDPAQAHLRQEWLEARDHVANKLTDNEFYARDEAAGGHAGAQNFKLDPGDHSPGNETQMDHWKDLHEEIVHGTPAQTGYTSGQSNWEVPLGLTDPNPLDPHMSVTPDDVDPGIYIPENPPDMPIDT